VELVNRPRTGDRVTDENPYQSPITNAYDQYEVVGLRRPGKRGPIFDVLLGGLVGAILAAPFHSHLNPIGIVCTLCGALLGGGVYRARSRNWPLNRRAWVYQWLVAAITLVAIPSILAMLSMRAATLDGTTIVTVRLVLYVWFSIASGILVSGPRRLDLTECRHDGCQQQATFRVSNLQQAASYLCEDHARDYLVEADEPA